MQNMNKMLFFLGLSIFITGCQMSLQQLDVEPELYQLSMQETQKARDAFHAIINQATYAAFEYSDKLSGCDFAPGEYEAAEKQYHIRLSEAEFSKLKHLLQNHVLVCGAVKNGEEVKKSAEELGQPSPQPCFCLYLFNETRRLACVYPGIIFDGMAELKAMFPFSQEASAQLEQMPSYHLYAQREASAQQELIEQMQEFENEE